MFGAATVGNPYYNKSLILDSVSAVFEMNREAALPRLIKNCEKLILQPEDMSVKVGASVAIRLQEVGAQLSLPAQVVVKKWIENPKGHYKASALARGLAIDWLVQKCRDEVETLSASDFATTFKKAPRELVEKGVRLFCEVEDRDSADHVAKRCMVPMASLLTAEDIRTVIKAANEGADLIGSVGFDEFLKTLMQVHPLGRESITSMFKLAGIEVDRNDEIDALKEEVD
jgi:hypothetical protein